MPSTTTVPTAVVLIIALAYVLAIDGIGSFPVIIDTDYGDFMDDVFALALAIQRPEFDIKLILTATQNAERRAQVLAQFLIGSGRSDIPIGVGVVQNTGVIGPLNNWRGAASYDLDTYPGGVYRDGIARVIEIIESSPNPTTIIELSPLTNIREFLVRRPDLASKVNFYAFLGSFGYCYGGVPIACNETNVIRDLQGAKQFFRTFWNYALVTPVDSSYATIIDGPDWVPVRNSNNRVILTLFESYFYWRTQALAIGYIYDVEFDPNNSSTPLFDGLTVYAAWSTALLEITTLFVEVLDNGLTVVAADGPPVDVALDFVPGGLQLWKKEIVDTLLGKALRGRDCKRKLKLQH